MKQFLTEIPVVKRRVIVYSHVTKVLIYSAKTYGDGPFRKIRMYLISRFFSIRENRENFMLAKYTWFTVIVSVDDEHAHLQGI